MTGQMQARVYYEDTDAGDVVYYASYLKFLERGRTEYLRQLGFSQRLLAREEGLAFAVRSLQAEYLRPARLDDLLDIHTQMEEIRRAQVIFAQSIRRDDEILLTARVRVACMSMATGKAVAIPLRLRNQLVDNT